MKTLCRGTHSPALRTARDSAAGRRPERHSRTRWEPDRQTRAPPFRVEMQSGRNPVGSKSTWVESPSACVNRSTRSICKHSTPIIDARFGKRSNHLLRCRSSPLFSPVAARRCRGRGMARTLHCRQNYLILLQRAADHLLKHGPDALGRPRTVATSRPRRHKTEKKSGSASVAHVRSCSRDTEADGRFPAQRARNDVFIME